MKILFKRYFLAIVESLSLLNDKNVKTLLNLAKEKYPLIYIACLAQGLLQSRQSLICGGIQKCFFWSTTWIVDTLSAIHSYNNIDTSSFGSYLFKVIKI